jgi:hypothetical protein
MGALFDPKTTAPRHGEPQPLSRWTAGPSHSLTRARNIAMNIAQDKDYNDKEPRGRGVQSHHHNTSAAAINARK